LAGTARWSLLEKSYASSLNVFIIWRMGKWKYPVCMVGKEYRLSHMQTWQVWPRYYLEKLLTVTTGKIRKRNREKKVHKAGDNLF
jgi:hypothetical protein